MTSERRFTGHIHRAKQQAGDRNKMLLRRYATSDNAFERLHNFMLREGKVGDVCEVVHSITGMQLGTVKMTLQDRIIVDKVWERDIK